MSKKVKEINIRYFSEDILPLEYIDGKSDWIDLRAAKDMVIKAGERALIPLGVVSIITGCLLFISSLLIKIVFILFKIDNKETLKFILNIIKDLRYNLNLSGIIITIVGIIMIILYNIIKKKKNSK